MKNIEEGNRVRFKLPYRSKPQEGKVVKVLYHGAHGRYLNVSVDGIIYQVHEEKVIEVLIQTRRI